MTQNRVVSTLGDSSIAGKNYLLNGAFDVWTRGTSISLAASANAFTADKWYASSQGANTAITISRQTTGDTTNLPNIQYCARVQRNSGQTGTSNILFVNSFETISSIPLAGKTVTLSFYARAGANYSASSLYLVSTIISGTGTDQNRALVGYTGEVSTSSGATLTTTWQRFVVTGTVSATTTEVAAYFSYGPTGTAGTNDYFEVTGVQLEVGSVATLFNRSGGSLQAETSAVAGIDITGNLNQSSISNMAGYQVAGKNKIINGDMAIWQRGTSFSLADNIAIYTADRIYSYSGSGGSAAATVSQQAFTPGTAPVAGYEAKYFHRHQQTSAATVNNPDIELRLEDVRTFAGQTMTLSFWAKAAATYTPVEIIAHQYFGTGGSPSADVYTAPTTSVQSFGTTWQRYVYTFNIPSLSGKTIGTANNSYFRLYITHQKNQTFTFDTWGWQAEAGSVATPFTTATGNPQGELAACQRYYLLVASGVGGPIAAAWYPTSTLMSTIVNFPVEMRTAPTVVQTTGTGYYNLYAVAGNDAFNSLTIDVRSTRSCLLYNNTEISGTAGSTGNSTTNNASASLALSAEL